MISGQASVMESVRHWLAAGERVWLCTIVETWGSSPRPVGSWLAVSETGHWSGSVSGGCLEEDLLRRTAAEGPVESILIDYGITDGDRDRFQLPCGGRIRLLVEPLVASDHLPHIERVSRALSERQPIRRKVIVGGGMGLIGEDGNARNGVAFDGQTLVHTLQPECRLLLIGAGEVARHVAEFASAAEFTVTLCEPRDTFADGWQYPHIPLSRRLPDDLIADDFGDRWCGILALAHDPRVDDMGLLAALQSPAFYVGAMGSRKTSEARRSRLADLGLDEAALSRLRAPIGVNIPSKTPAEIAISIVADLIAARHDLRAAQASL
ncbi:XdhC family protein [Marinobacter sp.]|uniref:XdhC family protein n=1 Tax=Marinobacter sp. TaxID=50741 RepID=UPI0035668668